MPLVYSRKKDNFVALNMRQLFIFNHYKEVMHPTVDSSKYYIKRYRNYIYVYY